MDNYGKSRLWVKKQIHHFADKVHIFKSMVFPVVMYGCERLTIKKAEDQTIDAFKLWSWRRLMRVPWTIRRSNHSVLKKINPEYSLERLMLKLKLQYFGHLMWKVNSLVKILMLGKIEGWRRRGWQRFGCLVSPIQWTGVWANSGRWWRTGKPVMLQSMGSQWVSDWLVMWLSDWATITIFLSHYFNSTHNKEKILKYNMPSISVNICFKILFLKGFFFITINNNCVIMIFLERLFWILFHQSCTYIVVYIIFGESFSLSLTLKLIIFAICLFLPVEIFFPPNLLVFSQQEYYFKQIGLFICSASGIGMIMFGS